MSKFLADVETLKQLMTGIKEIAELITFKKNVVVVQEKTIGDTFFLLTKGMCTMYCENVEEE